MGIVGLTMAAPNKSCVHTKTEITEDRVVKNGITYTKTKNKTTEYKDGKALGETTFIKKEIRFPMGEDMITKTCEVETDADDVTSFDMVWNAKWGSEGVT